MKMPCPTVIARAPSVQLTQSGSPARLCFLHRSGKYWNNLKQVTHNPVVGDLENRCFLVLVDRDDRARRTHAGKMLNRSRYSHRDVQLWAYESACLPNLVAMRTPSFIGYDTRCTDRSVAKCSSEIFEKLEVLGTLQSPTTAHDYGGLAQIELRTTAEFHLFHHNSRCGWVTDGLCSLYGARTRIFHWGKHVRANSDQRRLRRHLYSRHDLPDVHRMLHYDRIAIKIDRCDIRDKPNSQLGRNARCQVAAKGGCRKNRNAIGATAYAFRNCRGERFRIVFLEASVLHDDDRISPIFRELFCVCTYARRSRYECVNIATRFIGDFARRSYGFEANLAKFSVSRLSECKNVCHFYSTLASV